MRKLLMMVLVSLFMLQFGNAQSSRAITITDVKVVQEGDQLFGYSLKFDLKVHFVDGMEQMKSGQVKPGDIVTASALVWLDELETGKYVVKSDGVVYDILSPASGNVTILDALLIAQ